jgi:hypothetical protein
MPISFAAGGSHFDVTPLENLFIENYMAEATGDFVKAYIYGLKFCYRQEDQPQEIEDVARDLRMSEEAVRAAFAYWEEKGLLRVVSQHPLGLEYVNLKQMFIDGSKAQEPPQDKSFEELVGLINAIFQDRRVVTPAEFDMAYGWYEALRFELHAIPLLINYCVEEKGDKLPFKYVDSVAQDWAGKGITSVDEVEQQLKMLEARKSGAAKVLSRWSLRRAPTVDEMLLYRKWTEEWGFDDAAIMAAISENTATGNPNFKYFDGILSSLYESGAVTAQMVRDELEKRRNLKGVSTDIARALGLRMSASNSAELMNLYAHFSSLGFSDSSMLLAARMLCLENRSTLADLAARLSSWYEDGTVSDEVLKVNREKSAEIDRTVQSWLEKWGQSRAPTPGERAACVRFTQEWGFPGETVAYAAELAAFADHPLAMTGRLLATWKEKGIRDREAAKRDWQNRRGGEASAAREDFAERNFTNQHTYTPEQFDSMKTGIFDLKDL